MSNVFSIKRAREQDINIIETFIHELAVFEKLQDQVRLDPGSLYHWMFIEKRVDVLLAYENQTPIGFVLYFYNFSTFLKKAGLYIEDIYLRPAYRKKGYGTLLFQQLAKIAYAKNCGRIELSVLNWNQEGIDFYVALGAKPLEEWTMYRLDEQAIQKIACS